MNGGAKVLPPLEGTPTITTSLNTYKRAGDLFALEFEDDTCTSIFLYNFLAGFKISTVPLKDW